MIVVVTTLLALAPTPTAASPTMQGEPEPSETALPEPPPPTRTIVVTGTRTHRSQNEAVVATQVYDRQTIEQSGAENLADILDQTPGVQLSPGIGGMGIRMQGLDPSYTAVLVDGQRTTGRVNGVLDLSRFPAEQIEQVEVVRGPSSVLYGADALAGTINLISRRPKDRHEAELHLAYASRDTLDLTGRIGFAHSKYRGSLTGGWHRTAGWDADPSDLSTTGARSEQMNLATTHDFDGFGPFSLGMQAQYLQRDARRVDAQPSGAVFDRTNRSEVIQGTLAPTIEGPQSRLTISLGYNLFRDQFLQDQRGATALDQSQDTYDHLAQFTAQYDHELGHHVISAGSDTQLEYLASARIDPPHVQRQRYAIFAQDEWTPTRSPTIVILPGLRLDYDTYFGVYPTPRLALMLIPNERWTLRASYGRGYRSPSFREMFLLFSNPSVGYTIRGNPNLKAETSWSSSVSAEFSPYSGVWLSANVFDNRLHDTIVTDATNPNDEETTTLFEYINVGEATTRGIESLASFTLLEHLVVEGSYTFVHTYNHATGRPLPGRPRHAGTAGLHYSRPASGTSIRLLSAFFGARKFYIDNRDDNGFEERTSPGFTTIDMRLSQRVFQYLQIFAGIENLLNAGNATDNPIQPRTYYGGLTARY